MQYGWTMHHHHLGSADSGILSYDGDKRGPLSSREKNLYPMIQYNGNKFPVYGRLFSITVDETALIHTHLNIYKTKESK